VDTAGLGESLLSKRAPTLRRGRPWLLECPWSSRVGRLLEGTNAGESWVERDLWRSWDRVDRCLGASLHLPVVMHAVYWSTKESWFPKVDSSGGWGSSGVTVVAITNVSSASARGKVLGICGPRGRGSELKIRRYPVIGTGVWLGGTVSS